MSFLNLIEIVFYPVSERRKKKSRENHRISFICFFRKPMHLVLFGTWSCGVLATQTQQMQVKSQLLQMKCTNIRGNTDLWANEQHRAVLGARAEGQVVDAESVFLARLETNTPHCTHELAVSTIWGTTDTIIKELNLEDVNTGCVLTQKHQPISYLRTTEHFSSSPQLPSEVIFFILKEGGENKIYKILILHNYLLSDDST